MTPSAANLIISDLRFRYAADGQDVLRVPRLMVPNSQFVSILGSSGCGKSTLLRLIAGLLHPGDCTISGTQNDESQGHRSAIGMVFQNANLIPWRTARQNVRLPAELGRTPVTVSDDQLSSLFRLVGLHEQDTRKRSTELSGGMQQRVGLARAFATDAPILLIHGKDDIVVRFRQSSVMADALKDAGKPYQLIELEGEDHWLSRGETRLKMLTAAAAFIKKHNPPDPAPAKKPAAATSVISAMICFIGTPYMRVLSLVKLSKTD